MQNLCIRYCTLIPGDKTAKQFYKKDSKLNCDLQCIKFV